MKKLEVVLVGMESDTKREIYVGLWAQEIYNLLGTNLVCIQYVRPSEYRLDEKWEDVDAVINISVDCDVDSLEYLEALHVLAGALKSGRPRVIRPYGWETSREYLNRVMDSLRTLVEEKRKAEYK